MYRFRITLFIILALLIAAVILTRLADLQFRQADYYRARLSDRGNFAFKPIPAKRGRILATGPGGAGYVELVGNKPSFELAVFYPLMDPDPEWITGEVRRIRKERKTSTQPATLPPEEQLQQDIDAFWGKLAELTGEDPATLQYRRDRAVRIVRRNIAAVEKRQKAEGNLAEDANLDYAITEQRMAYPVVSDLDHDEAVRLRLAFGGKEWATIRPSYSRDFRPGHTLCHLLGRTRREPGSPAKVFAKNVRDIIDTQGDVEDHERQPLPGQLIGRTGLESAYDSVLRGRHGWAELSDPPMPAIEAKDGSDLVLTIDYDLQNYCEQRIRDRIRGGKELPDGGTEEPLNYATGGAAVVLNLEDNSILALASLPTYDPAALADPAIFEQLLSDHKRLPLLNKALLGRYPAGSIVKPIVTQFAFDAGVTTSGRQITCVGRYSEDNPAFRCWLYTGHGPMNAEQAIAQSCDIYFYHIGEEICGLVPSGKQPADAERLCSYYRKYGFGESPAGLLLPTSKGFVPDQAWFMQQWKRTISRGDARNLAIGQGDLLITPLQAVNMLSALLNGQLRPVRLAKNDRLPEPKEIGISRASVPLVRRGMEEVVADASHGGAYTTVHTDRVPLAGKTGSAQAPLRPIGWTLSYVDGEGKTREMNSNNPWQEKLQLMRDDPAAKEFRITATQWYPSLSEEDTKLRTDRPNKPAHAWFLGYAPAERPKVAIVVLIEYGMAGSKAAGPVFRDIALKCQDLGYLK